MLPVQLQKFCTFKFVINYLYLYLLLLQPFNASTQKSKITKNWNALFELRNSLFEPTAEVRAASMYFQSCFYLKNFCFKFQL